MAFFDLLAANHLLESITLKGDGPRGREAEANARAPGVLAHLQTLLLLDFPSAPAARIVSTIEPSPCFMCRVSNRNRNREDGGLFPILLPRYARCHALRPLRPWTSFNLTYRMLPSSMFGIAPSCSSEWVPLLPSSSRRMLAGKKSRRIAMSQPLPIFCPNAHHRVVVARRCGHSGL